MRGVVWRWAAEACSGPEAPRAVASAMRRAPVPPPVVAWMLLSVELPVVVLPSEVRSVALQVVPRTVAWAALCSAGDWELRWNSAHWDGTHRQA